MSERVRDCLSWIGFIIWALILIGMLIYEIWLAVRIGSIIIDILS